MPDDDLPDFDEKKIYFVRGATLNALKSAIRTNKPYAVTEGGLEVDDQGENGQHISLAEANSTPPSDG